MAMQIRTVARATQPHQRTLDDALRPLLALGTPASSFHSRYQDGMVVIEQNSFDGVDMQAVENEVASAPEHSEALDVKAQINALPLLFKAIVLALVDAINTERAQHGRAAITPQAAVNAIVAKVDELT